MFSGMQWTRPLSRSGVQGFCISIERKGGTLLKGKSKDGNTPSRPGSASEYFEVTVVNDGSNKLYPKPSRHVLRLTNCLSKGSQGYLAPGIHYFPKGTRIRSVEVSEAYDDGQGYEFGWPEPCYRVWCRVNLRGKHGGSAAVGLAERPR